MPAILLTFLAGAMNGSFAIPTKHAHHWRFENIWLNFALWGFVFLPWVIIFSLDPHINQVYHIIPSYTWLILIIGGFLFGIGQTCFALSLQRIGFSLGFTINIGLGTALGFFIPLLVLHPEELFTPIGLGIFIALGFIILGLTLSYRAGKKRDQNRKLNVSLQGSYQAGIWLALIAGLCSAIQNFSFAFTTNIQQLAIVLGANSLAASIIIWPPFLLATFVAYASFMLYLHARHNSFACYIKPYFWRYQFYAGIMGLLWFGSMLAYSQASLWIGALGPEIAWPLFMVSIILTASFWGWRYKEWQGCNAHIARMVLLSILSLIVAVTILGYMASLSPN